MAHIGFVVSRSPLESPGARVFYHLAVAALEKGHTVSVFCHENGIYQALNRQYLPDREQGSPSNWWRALLARGLKATVSEVCALSRGIQPDMLLEGVNFGSTLELAEMLERCDRVICI